MLKSNRTKRFIAVALVLLSTLTVASEVQGRQLGGPVQLPEKRQPKTLTPLSDVQLLRILRDSHVEVFGIEPSIRRLAMAWAQVALENGQGKFLWNHNLGNIGPGSSQQEYYSHSSFTTYRAFEGFLLGGQAYWQTIERSTVILRQFESGDPRGVATSLKNSGYYGADCETYGTGMVGLYWHAIQKVIPEERQEASRVGQD
jgi:hypothetical protein